MDVQDLVAHIRRQHWNQEAAVNGLWQRLLNFVYPLSEWDVQPEALEQHGPYKQKADLVVRQGGTVDTLMYEGKGADGETLDQALIQLHNWFRNYFYNTQRARMWGIVARGQKFKIYAFATVSGRIQSAPDFVKQDYRAVPINMSERGFVKATWQGVGSEKDPLGSDYPVDIYNHEEYDLLQVTHLRLLLSGLMANRWPTANQLPENWQ